MAQGRWVNKDPEILKPLDQGSLKSFLPSEHSYFDLPLKHQKAISIFDFSCLIPDPKTGHKPNIVFGVDTSGGKGRDNHALVAITEHKKIVATFYYSFGDTHQYAKVVQCLFQIFQPKCLVIETNGHFGEAVKEWLDHEKVISMALVKDLFQGEDSKEQCLEASKLAIEVDGVCAGKELFDECQSVYRHQGNKLVTGTKDLLMALGMALRELPHWKSKVPVKAKDPRDVIQLSKYIGGKKRSYLHG